MSDAEAACLTPAPPSDQVAHGKVEKYGGLDVYVSGPASAKAAVILVSDIYGYEVPQFRKIVDLLGSRGYLALGPDLLHGEPVGGPAGGDRATWLTRHQPDAEIPNVKSLEEIVSSQTHVTAYALVGFCWGGKVAALAAAEGLAECAVLFHPSRVTVEDIKAVKVPIAVLGAEIDKATPPDLVREFKRSRDADPELGPTSVFKVYPNTSHGYAVKYDPSDAAAVKVANDSYDDMLEFLRGKLEL